MFYNKGMKYFIPWMSIAVLILGVIGWIVFSKEKGKEQEKVADI